MNVFKSYLPNIVFNLIAGAMAPFVFVITLLLLFGLFQPSSTSEKIQGVVIAGGYLIFVCLGEYFVYRLRNKENTAIRWLVLTSILCLLIGGFVSWLIFYLTMT